MATTTSMTPSTIGNCWQSRRLGEALQAELRASHGDGSCRPEFEQRRTTSALPPESGVVDQSDEALAPALAHGHHRRIQCQIRVPGIRYSQPTINRPRTSTH
jgi:hypothetical protein